MSEEKGQSHPPGSPEDYQLTLKILSQFITNKMKAAEMYRQKGESAATTGATKSICHIDGVTDNDEGAS
jgi:hypothetical protein